ncbi:MAG: thioredoxin family protein [Candidatus Dormibacteria bacterium]
MTIALAPLFAAVVIGGAAAMLVLQRRHQRQLVGRTVSGAPSGPAILYFSGAACAVCHTAQRPALDRLQSATDGNPPVHEIDVLAEPEIARRYRVMSLPTTIVLDHAGRAVAINTGLATSTQLREQLAKAGLD